MFIYKITFPNQKVYIGQTIETISIRASHHKTDAMLNRDVTEFSPMGSKICNAIRKYGLELDWIEVIDTSDNLEDLNHKEIYWITHYNSLNTGYNTKPGGNNKLHSESTKIKIGNATKDRWKKPEIAEKMKDGLRKGTQTTKSRTGEIRIERVEFVCEMCGKIFKDRPKEKRRFCSRKCASKYASDIAKIKQKPIIIKKMNNNIKIIKELVYSWSLENKDIISQCTLNKISTNLSPLLEITGINDWRTLTKYVIGSESRKNFLIHLVEYVKIYADPTDE